MRLDLLRIKGHLRIILTEAGELSIGAGSTTKIAGEKVTVYACNLTALVRDIIAPMDPDWELIDTYRINHRSELGPAVERMACSAKQ